MQPSEKSMTMMKRRAKPVSKGTIFFMNNGQLHTMQAPGICLTTSDQTSGVRPPAGFPAAGRTVAHVPTSQNPKFRFFPNLGEMLVSGCVWKTEPLTDMNGK